MKKIILSLALLSFCSSLFSCSEKNENPYQVSMSAEEQSKAISKTTPENTYSYNKFSCSFMYENTFNELKFIIHRLSESDPYFLKISKNKDSYSSIVDEGNEEIILSKESNTWSSKNNSNNLAILKGELLSCEKTGLPEDQLFDLISCGDTYYMTSRATGNLLNAHCQINIEDQGKTTLYKIKRIFDASIKSDLTNSLYYNFDAIFNLKEFQQIEQINYINLQKDKLTKKNKF